MLLGPGGMAFPGLGGDSQYDGAPDDDGCEWVGPRVDGISVQICNGRAVAYRDAQGNVMRPDEFMGAAPAGVMQPMPMTPENQAKLMAEMTPAQQKEYMATYNKGLQQQHDAEQRRVNWIVGGVIVAGLGLGAWAFWKSRQ